MKKILITGVSRGLGKILTEFLTSQEYIVYGTVRELEHYKDSENVKYVYLNLQDKESIDQAVAQIFQAEGTLDAVIHNAGVAYLDPSDVMSDQERRHLFDVNFFGPVYLTEKILPYMRSANRGKLIFISSIASVDHWPFLGMYGASKAALEAVAFEWAVLLKEWNINVSVVRPNPLPTDMGMLRSENSHLSSYKSQFCNELKWESVEDVCNLILEILRNPDPAFDYQTGKFSQQAVDSILKKNAHQSRIDQYLKILKPTLAS